MGDSSQRPLHGGEPPAGNTVDWRVRLTADKRQKLVNAMLKATLVEPNLTGEALLRIKKHVEQVEEVVYAKATSSSGYIQGMWGAGIAFSTMYLNEMSERSRNRRVGTTSTGAPRQPQIRQQNVQSCVNIHGVVCPIPNMVELSEASVVGTYRGHPVDQGPSNVWANSQRQIDQFIGRLPREPLEDCVYEPQQRADSQQQNTPWRLQASSQSQRASLDSPSTSGVPIGGDWQEEIHQRVTRMKDRYLPNLCAIYLENTEKSLQGLPESERSQNLSKSAAVENTVRFLLVQKPNNFPVNEETLDKNEMYIFKIINALSPSKAGSQMKRARYATTPIQGQPEILRSSLSQTPSMQPRSDMVSASSLQQQNPIKSLHQETRGVGLGCPDNTRGNALVTLDRSTKKDRILGSALGSGSVAMVGANLVAETENHRWF